MARTKAVVLTPPEPKKRVRRTEEQLVQELEARIQQLKARAAVKAVKKDPALAYISKAVRAIDQALSATGDPTTRTALTEARGALAACLQLPPSGDSGASRNGHARRSNAPDAEAVLSYLQANPGQRSEEITQALDTNAVALRSVMKALMGEGKVKTKGEKRATRYWPAG